MNIERLPIYYRALSKNSVPEVEKKSTKKTHSHYHCNTAYTPVVFYKVISKIVSIGDYQERKI
jgi:hypothetical protein